MTLATWKAEFYPIEASECSEADAIEHSLRKWRGLRARVLAAHGITVTKYGDLSETHTTAFRVSASTCALCQRHEDCATCPLFISRNLTTCEHRTLDENIDPFAAWQEKSDPEPMIAALEKALKEQS